MKSTLCLSQVLYGNQTLCHVIVAMLTDSLSMFS